MLDCWSARRLSSFWERVAKAVLTLVSRVENCSLVVETSCSREAVWRLAASFFLWPEEESEEGELCLRFEAFLECLRRCLERDSRPSELDEVEESVVEVGGACAKPACSAVKPEKSPELGGGGTTLDGSGTGLGEKRRSTRGIFPN